LAGKAAWFKRRVNRLSRDIKQTAWPFLLLWLIMVVVNHRQSALSRLNLWRALGWCAVVLAAAYLPFLIWHRWRYGTTLSVRVGNAANVYAFSGATILKYFSLHGFIKSPWPLFRSAFFS